MSTNQIAPRKPLRLWPGVTLAVLLLLVRFVAPVFPDGAMLGLIGSVAVGALIVLWWLLFSRAPWGDRIGAVLLMVVAVFATYFVVHESIRGGMMGYMVPIILAIPSMSVALVAWAAATRRL